MNSRPPAPDAGELPLRLVDGGLLHVEHALQLLARGGMRPPDELAAGSAAWIQAVLDGLCALSSRDPLTGLVNRRLFEAALEREIDRVARTGETALLLLVDIDHFKRVNDTHGHAAGDLVIQAVGRALQDCVRPMDTVARIGGEEFAIVLPNCPPAFARTVAERIRARIESHPVPLNDLQQQLAITISLGGAFAPQWVRSTCALWLERADQQLYRAKAGGRNQVCLETPAISEVSAEERGMLFAPSSMMLPEDFQTTTS